MGHKRQLKWQESPTKAPHIPRWGGTGLTLTGALGRAEMNRNTIIGTGKKDDTFGCRCSGRTALSSFPNHRACFRCIDWLGFCVFNGFLDGIFKFSFNCDRWRIIEGDVFYRMQRNPIPLVTTTHKLPLQQLPKCQPFSAHRKNLKPQRVTSSKTFSRDTGLLT